MLRLQRKNKKRWNSLRKGYFEHELWEKAPQVKLSVDQARMTRDQAVTCEARGTVSSRENWPSANVVRLERNAAGSSE